MAGFKNDVVIAENGARIGDEIITGTEQASVQFSESGSAVALLVNNTSGTAGSSAYEELRIENTSAEMVFQRWAVKHAAFGALLGHLGGIKALAIGAAGILSGVFLAASVNPAALGILPSAIMFGIGHLGLHGLSKPRPS